MTIKRVKKLYPKDILEDATSRNPWPSPTVCDWYMEGRMIERELASQKIAAAVAEMRDVYRASPDVMVSAEAVVDNLDSILDAPQSGK